MKRAGIYLGSSLLLVVLFYLSLTTGIIHIHSSLWSVLSDHNSVDGMTVWQIRLPRALGAVIIGAALGIAGALAQAIFRNPLAEPTLIGLSSGATLGSIAVISTGAATYGTRTNVMAAIGIALCAAGRDLHPGYQTPSTQNSTVKSLTLNTGLATDCTFRIAILWNDTHMSSASEKTFRARGVFGIAGAYLVLILGSIYAVFNGGTATAKVAVVLWSLLALVLLYSGILRPRLLYSNEQITIINPFSTVEASWNHIRSVRGQFNLEFLIDEEKVSVWAITAPSARKSLSAMRRGEDVVSATRNNALPDKATDFAIAIHLYDTYSSEFARSNSSVDLPISRTLHKGIIATASGILLAAVITQATLLF